MFDSPKEEQGDPAQASFDQAREAAWKTFSEAVEPYQKAYDEAMDAALAEYNTAMGLDEEAEEEEESSPDAPISEITFDLGPTEEE